MSNNNLRFAMPGEGAFDEEASRASNDGNWETARGGRESLPDFSKMTKQQIKEFDAVHGSYKRLLGDRPITLIWLLNHYSRANSEAYSRQKMARKEQKGNTGSGKTEIVGHKETEEDSNQEKRSVQANRIDFERPKGVDYTTKNDGLIDEDNPATIMMGSQPKEVEYRALSKAGPRLVCVGFGQTVSITQTPYIIGRSKKGVNLCIADNGAISSHHARITEKNGQFYISDLGSMNHVFINGTKIPENVEVLLKDDMHFNLADEEFIFKAD